MTSPRRREPNERSLYRLLRALASIGIFREEDGRRFSSTPLAERLQQSSPDTLHGWAAFVGRPPTWQAWGDLLHSVRTGENAFRHVHGVDVWESRADDAEERAVFDRAMTDITRGINRSLLDAYDFGRFSKVVDVGGGRGALLDRVARGVPGHAGCPVRPAGRRRGRGCRPRPGGRRAPRGRRRQLLRRRACVGRRVPVEGDHPRLGRPRGTPHPRAPAAALRGLAHPCSSSSGSSAIRTRIRS